MDPVKKSYFIHLIIVSMVFVALQAARHLIPMDISPATAGWAAAWLFFSTAVFALGLPVLYRLVFVHQNRNSTGVSEKAFIRFEKNLVHLIMVAPYLVLAGYYLQIPGFHFTGSALMGLYAVYFYFPSHRRMAAERCLFRVGKAVSPTAMGGCPQ